MALALLANYYWYNQIDNDERALDSRISSTREDISKLEKTIGEVKSITAEKKALEDKLKILDNLKKGRTGPVKVMDELSSLIPARVWLLDYTEQGGGVVMHGSAVTYEDLRLLQEAEELETLHRRRHPARESEAGRRRRLGDHMPRRLRRVSCALRHGGRTALGEPGSRRAARWL